MSTDRAKATTSEQEGLVCLLFLFEGWDGGVVYMLPCNFQDEPSPLDTGQLEGVGEEPPSCFDR